jgi:hypothetical protein
VLGSHKTQFVFSQSKLGQFLRNDYVLFTPQTEEIFPNKFKICHENEHKWKIELKKFFFTSVFLNPSSKVWLFGNINSELFYLAFETAGSKYHSPLYLLWLIGTCIFLTVVSGGFCRLHLLGSLLYSKPTHHHIKGKAVPLQFWNGPEGSRKLRSPDFMKTAQDGSKFVSLTHRPPLLPGNTPGTRFC